MPDPHKYTVTFLLHVGTHNKTGRRAWPPPLDFLGGVSAAPLTMTRKDSEKDSDRTHYYSQFWLDVAAGRRIIGAPKEDEAAEAEVLEPSLPLRRSSRSTSYDDSNEAEFDGHDERIVHPVAEPLATPEEFIDAEPEEIDLETSNADAPDFQEEVVDDIDIPDMDLGPADEEKDEDELPDEEEAEEGEAEEGEAEEEGAEEGEAEEEGAEEEGAEEDEEDEDLGWGGRGRKRNKPVRPKAPPKKAPRREPRRGY